MTSNPVYSHLRRFSLLAWLFASLAVPVLADVNVHFRTMGVTGGLDGVSYKMGGQYVPLDILLFSCPTKAYPYSGNDNMGLYRMGKVDGQPAMVLIGNVTFPDRASGTYMAIFAGEAGGPVNGSAVSLDGAQFPAHSVRILNVSPLSLNIFCDGSTFNLKPGAFSVVKPHTEQYVLSVRMMNDGQPNEVASGMYPLNSSARNTIFLILTNIDQMRADHTVSPQVQIVLFADAPTAPGSSE
jgi:hypothetical protein